MEKNTINPRFLFVAVTIIIASFMRLIPHWPNFTPIAAIALFGGTYLGKKYLSFIIPFAALFLSDLFLGFHSSMIAVYASFAITVLIGFYLRKNVKAGSVIVASLLSSIIFFVITNFSSWLFMPMYSKDFLGLMECYTAGLMFFNDGSYGISFFLNSILGGLAYNTLLFGAFYLAKLKFPVLSKA